MRRELIEGDIVQLVRIAADKPGEPRYVIPVRGVPADAGPIKTNAKLGIQHTANFRIVQWGRERFTFSHKQSLVIEALANAAGQGHGWLDQATLLECADSDAARLLDLFRGHPAWGRFLVRATSEADRPGAFRLAEPME